MRRIRLDSEMDSENATRLSYQDSVFVFLKLFFLVATNFQFVSRFLIKLILIVLPSCHFFGGTVFSRSLLYHFC